MKDTLQQLFEILSDGGRRKLMFFIGLSFVSALGELVGIGSIVPFLAAVANPHSVATNHWVMGGLSWLGRGEGDLPLILAVVAFLALTFSGVLAACTKWYGFQFGQEQSHLLTMRLLKYYTVQRYEWFLAESVAEICTKINSEARFVVSGIIVPVTEVTVRLATACVICIGLLILDPIVALATGFLIGGSYCLIYLFLRPRLHAMGDAQIHCGRRLIRFAHEQFHGFKEVRVNQVQDFFLRRAEEMSLRLRVITASVQAAQQIPRHVLEVLTFGGVIALTGYLASGSRNVEAYLPILTLYAVAAYKLMPALQQCFQGMAQIRFGLPVLDKLRDDLAAARNADLSPPPDIPAPLPFEHKVQFRGVSFRYQGAGEYAVQDVDLEIHPGERIAFVGATGAGKSTLVDLLLGLLNPTEGEILVDGRPLEGETLRRWQRALGYVPQKIFLLDDNVWKNVAFGIPDEEVDKARVIRCLEIARIEEAISRLPNKHDTFVGDQGGRLSGGERQRIGIARALYREPRILIFDEATSALDNLTEGEVVAALQGVDREQTLVLIAHRLSTVVDCDRIFVMDGGRVVGRGTYSELLLQNQIFRRLARSRTSVALPHRQWEQSMWIAKADSTDVRLPKETARVCAGSLGSPELAGP